MPISKREYELGVDSAGSGFMLLVYNLLYGTRELAYSRDELRETILGSSYDTHQSNQFDAAISALVRISAIESRSVSDIDYYAYFQEFDTEKWETSFSKV